MPGARCVPDFSGFISFLCACPVGSYCTLLIRDVGSQMNLSDKTYWLQKIQSERGSFCLFDVTLLQTSKDRTDFGSTGEVKINPFNDEKGRYIKDSFNLGKLDWATVVIVTEPATANLEEQAANMLKAFQDPKSLSTALQQNVKVSLPAVVLHILRTVQFAIRKLFCH